MELLEPPPRRDENSGGFGESRLPDIGERDRTVNRALLINVSSGRR